MPPRCTAQSGVPAGLRGWPVPTHPTPPPWPVPAHDGYKAMSATWKRMMSARSFVGLQLVEVGQAVLQPRPRGYGLSRCASPGRLLRYCLIRECLQTTLTTTPFLSRGRSRPEAAVGVAADPAGEADLHVGGPPQVEVVSDHPDRRRPHQCLAPADPHRRGRCHPSSRPIIPNEEPVPLT